MGVDLRRSALLDKNIGDWISVGRDVEGVRVAAVNGVPGDNNRTNDNREGETKPSVSSATVRAREFDQAATKPPLRRFVTFSDTVDSSRANVKIIASSCGQITSKPMLVMESRSDCLSTGG